MVHGPQTSSLIDLEIRGMHCGGCVATVEKALRKLPGVTSAAVNLATQRAAVWLDHTAAPNTEALVQAVRDAGFDAEAVATRPVGADRAHAHGADDLRAQRGRLLLTIGLGLPLVLLHVVHMLPAMPGWLHHFVVTSTGTGGGWAVQGVLALLVVGAGARQMIGGAVRALLARSANMDVLISLGIVTGLGSGVVGLLTGDASLVIFDAAALIVMFVTVGKYLEARARQRAVGALHELATQIPREALRIVGDHTEAVPVETVRPGDLLRVPAHALIPVDAEIISGRATVDESLLTGESVPVERKAGERVFGGTRVFDGLIDVRATATGAESAAARIAKLVEDAQATKPPWQRLADRLAAVFVPVVVTIALVTLAGWLWLGGASASWALQRTIAVLVVACPCALGLAIPTAVLVGTTRAAQLGILVRDAAALEAAGSVREVLLDKTGTLTLGRPAVEQIEVTDAADETEVLRLAVALEQFSEHPLARAIVATAAARGLTPDTPEGLESRPGEGLRGRLASTLVLVGNAKWLNENGVNTRELDARADALAARGMAVVWVARDGRVAGLLGLADPLHPESAAAVAELHRLGVRTRILSGDRHAAVSRVAGELGIDAFEAQLSPQEKLDRVRQAAGEGRHVAMVGDGINDAPALAAADVGLALGAGADIARQAAPICLLGNSPRLIAEAIRISRASARIMRQNLGWALGYNVVMLPVAALAPLPPALATAAMMCSSLSVVLNSLRLRRAR